MLLALQLPLGAQEHLLLFLLPCKYSVHPIYDAVATMLLVQDVYTVAGMPLKQRKDLLDLPVNLQRSSYVRHQQRQI